MVRYDFFVSRSQPAGPHGENHFRNSFSAPTRNSRSLSIAKGGAAQLCHDRLAGTYLLFPKLDDSFLTGPQSRYRS